jgi:hypothetical protein
MFGDDDSDEELYDKTSKSKKTRTIKGRRMINAYGCRYQEKEGPEEGRKGRNTR